MTKNLLKKTALTVAFICAAFFLNAQALSVNAGVDKDICTGGGTTIGGFASGGSPSYTYSWTPSTGLSSTTSVTPTASPTITTQYTVTVTDAVSATSTDVVVVTVWPMTSVAPSSNGPVCAGGTINLFCNPTGGPTTFTWTGPNSFTSSAQDPIIPLATLAASGTYTVNAMNGGGCAGMNTVNVLVNNTPTVTASSGTPICAGGTATLTASGASSYSWTTSATTPTILVSPGVTTTYSVIGTTSGCSDTANVTVTVNPLPTVTANSPSICVGGSATLNGSGAFSYAWTSGITDGVPFTPPTTSTYTVTGTDVNGCAGSATSTVTVNALPNVTTGGSNPSCFGMCDGSATATGAVTYTWSPGGQNTSVITSQCAGSYTVVGTDANGCVNNSSISIFNPTLLVAGFANIVNATCAGQTNGSVDGNPTGGTPGYTYSWSNGATSQSNSGLGANNYTLTVTDANLCTATGTVSIINATAAPTATITSVSSSCQGQPVTLTGVGSGGAAPYSYNWIDKQLAASVGTNTACTVAPTICGFDTVTFQVIDYNGCVGDTTQAIFINYSDSISGYVVDTAGFAVTSGLVYLFQDKSSHVGLGDTIAVTNIHPNGYYQFPNVFYGDYRIKFIADTTIYHTAIPNYYSTKPNAYQWDSATVINHYTCSATNVGGYNDTLIQLPASTTGPGIISGYVTPGTGYGQRLGHNSTLGAPLKGVDIKLGKNPGGNAAARTSTDVNGYYAFTNVPVGNYRIYVDIPNYGMDSVLIVSITPTVTTSNNNNYYVDSTMIRVDTAFGIGIKTNTGVNSNTLFVYPNPATNFVTVRSAKELGTIVLINSLGQTVYKEGTGNLQQRIDISHLPAGIYILNVQGKFVRLIKD